MAGMVSKMQRSFDTSVFFRWAFDSNNMWKHILPFQTFHHFDSHLPQLNNVYTVTFPLDEYNSVVLNSVIKDNTPLLKGFYTIITGIEMDECLSGK